MKQVHTFWIGRSLQRVLPGRPHKKTVAAIKSTGNEGVDKSFQ